MKKSHGNGQVKMANAQAGTWTMYVSNRLGVD